MVILLKKLEDVCSLFRGEIIKIRDFIEKMDQALEKEIVELTAIDFSAKDRKELAKLIKFVKKVVTRNRTGENKIIAPVKLKFESNKASDFIWSVATRVKYKSFLAEMTLSYLVSHQESFVKEYLHRIFISRPSILKSRQKQINYEEVCGFKSIKSLVSYLAKREVDSLGYTSIDDLVKYFKDRFNMNLEQFDGWPLVREATYRRNVIVHNAGLTNDIYCIKTGYKKKNKRLSTDEDYVKDLANVLLRFIKFLHGEMTEKLKLKPTKKKTYRRKQPNQ